MSVKKGLLRVTQLEATQLEAAHQGLQSSFCTKLIFQGLHGCL